MTTATGEPCVRCKTKLVYERAEVVDAREYNLHDHLGIYRKICFTCPGCGAPQTRLMNRWTAERIQNVQKARA